MLGHAILIFITVLFARNRAFHSKFKGISKTRARHWSTRQVSEYDISSNPHGRQTRVCEETHNNELVPIKNGNKTQVIAQQTPAEP